MTQALDIERHFHKYFKQYRKEGEWFTSDVLKFDLSNISKEKVSNVTIA